MSKDVVEELKAVFERADLKGADAKAAIQDFVNATWPDLPPWSTLEHPIIEEVQKASVGSGVLVTFAEKGERYTVMAQSGAHYGDGDPKFAIPGGFINLTHREGSSHVPPTETKDNQPENSRIGAARETEEEFKNADGSPLLSVDPARLIPMDMDSVAFPNGQKMVVQGLMLELTPNEVQLFKDHIAKLNSDEDYKKAVEAQTINPASGRPEVSSVTIHPLKNVAEGRVKLLHADQLSLFKIVHDHFEKSKPFKAPRQGPTPSYKEKVVSLDALRELGDTWRDDGHTIGVTSGVFDIPHPGHISFLEDAKAHSGKLVAIIASDRTVKEQKGEERPFINELKRAQTIAGLSCVDAVIVSDEQYHESILAALCPDFMFKGYDYADKDIIGADKVGEVVIIPCAEDNFFSSSKLVEAIKLLKSDTPPEWSQEPQ